ncbi:MAG: helical backbone metal receptor [Bacteroidota bacterium]
MRIISLVPSLTELLFDLDLGDHMVGRTKFCIHPKEKVKFIPKIGGTKTVKIDSIKALQPDLIIANKEENTKEDIEALQSIAQLYISEIANFEDALEAIKRIGHLTHRVDKSEKLIENIRSAFHQLHEDRKDRKSVCYLIWNKPLMTIGHDTFIHDMLDCCGYDNVFGNCDRYPETTFSEIQKKHPDFIFLSSEPFPFKERHITEFTEKCPDTKVFLVDGEYFSWYGSRMVGAASYFKSLKIEINKP